MMTRKLLISVCLQCLVLNSLYGEGAWTYCKDGWLAFNGSCYWFGDDAVHFTEAEHYCQQKDSHLIHVNTETENLFIKDHLRSLKSYNFWLGMTDEEIEDIWKWIDSDTRVKWFDWFPCQPNGGNTVDCALFWGAEGFDFKWADDRCTESGLAICEMRSVTANELELIGK